MNETSPELRLLLLTLQELAVWLIAGLATVMLRRRPDLERLPLRLAMLLSLLAAGLLAFGWGSTTAPYVVTRFATQTPPAMQAMLEEERSSGALQWASLLWALIATGLLARLLAQCVRSWRVAARSLPLTTLPPEVMAGHAWWPSIRLSDAIAAPATIGNVIVLPRSWSTLHVRAVRALLQHERGHVARGDFWWTLLSRTHLAVFWWNPFAWWADRRLSYLAECLSDDDALSAGHHRSDYAELLLHFVRGDGQASMELSAGLSTGLSAARSMHHRLDRILDRPDTWRRITASRSTMAGLSTVAALTLSMPVIWAAGAATEFRTPLRYVLVRPGGKDVLTSGSKEDVSHALAAVRANRQPVLWYARGSRVRIVDDACVTSEVEAFHRGQRASRSEPERRTFWLIRKIDKP